MNATGVPGAAYRAWSVIWDAHAGSPSTCQPREATQPRCVSSTCPTFIRLGTPSGLRTTSTGVPSARNGMSSTGRILEMTPLLPCRPASLSPSVILRFWATYTRTSWLTPGGSSSPSSRSKTLDADDRAGLAVRHLQRGVAHLARLLAEDRAEQPLLGGQLGLALGRHLAHQDVAGDDLGADPDDPPLVEVREDLLGDVRDVPGDLLGAQLGVAGVDLVLLDVDRGEDVVLHQALAEDDRVLVVVALPRHERDEQVLAERHLALSRCEGPSAIGVPTSSRAPSSTMTRWLYDVPWFDRRNLAIR